MCGGEIKHTHYIYTSELAHRRNQYICMLQPLYTSNRPSGVVMNHIPSLRHNVWCSPTNTVFRELQILSKSYAQRTSVNTESFPPSMRVVTVNAIVSTSSMMCLTHFLMILLFTNTFIRHQFT